MSGFDIEQRVGDIDWSGVSGELDAQGWAILPNVLDHAQADFISGLYERREVFRDCLLMARHGYGRGEYKCFDYPLPRLVEFLRATTYTRLAPIANRWHERLGAAIRYPDNLLAFLQRCHAGGQSRPTPLLLEYAPGDYNCLHRDVYGEHVFPLQIAILLDQPDEDFTGGEFVMTEQRPRMQSRPMVLPLRKGDGVVFAVATRPVKGLRGDYAVKLKHGVSKIRTGRRRALGVIFRDAI